MSSSISTSSHQNWKRARSTLNNKKEENPEIINEELAHWIRTEGLRRVNAGVSVEGILKGFNGTFNEKLTLRQFKILLEQAKEENKYANRNL